MTSLKNPVIQAFSVLKQKKEQDAAGLILVETRHPIEEAIKNKLLMKACFFLEGTERPAFLSDPVLSEVLSQTALYEVPERVMKKLAATQSVPPCLGVFAKPEVTLADFLLIQNPLILVLDGLQDAGNVGTLIRSAVAFGASGILLTQEAVNIYHPKVIRSSAGLVFAKPVLATGLTLDALCEQLKSRQIELLFATGHYPKLHPYRQANYRQPVALVLGKEGPGLDDAVIDRHQGQAVTIPMSGLSESLNVAVSGSVILAEADHQRRLS